MAGGAHADAIWTQIPPGAIPEDFARRREFLLGQVASGEAVLDLGSGAGEFSDAIRAAGATPIAVDVSAVAIARARDALPALDARLCRDGEALPLADGEVGGCWAGEVLEHVADVVGLAGEIRRVLAPGGWLAVTTPALTRSRLIVCALAPHGPEALFDVRSDHLRFFTRRSLRALLLDAGFERLVVGRRGRPGTGRLYGLARRPDR